MVNDFLNFAREENLFKKGDRILLAVSGGVDSVVMANLFWETGFFIGIAHCNFQLRGTAADEDAAFVEALASSFDAPFYTTRFETTTVAAELGISIQMAARKLRYEWLEAQRLAGNYSVVATAHHLDDSIETLLYNFTKGCGLHGLHGVPVRQGAIIRPLLFAHKEEVLHFAETREIAFRQDQSNLEDKYARNYIRHQVIPALKAVNPAFMRTAAANIRRLQEAEHLMNRSVAQLKSALTTETAEGILKIDLLRLRREQAAQTLLHEWLAPYGFHASALARLLNDKARTGAILYTPSHRLLLNRDVLVLEPLPEKRTETEFQIFPDTTEVALPDGILELGKALPPDSFGEDHNTAYLALSASDYPLRLRHWQNGDFFLPLGMNGKSQKIQDFFSNRKLSRFEKSKTWLLETADGRICWIVGLRADERFRIRQKKALCTQITWLTLG